MGKQTGKFYLPVLMRALFCVLASNEANVFGFFA
jgi:hypothetical protein